ncbi:hyaluronan synthase 1-like isoform X2 [Ascaphus truei]|uniref:hyaluronan synthase 1-like isoform X2 n=1 Tax=Ascaphus truei TaxID=8439 RepID=UPI003F59EF9F
MVMRRRRSGMRDHTLKDTPTSGVRCILTGLFATALCAGVLAANTVGLKLTRDSFCLTSLSIYGSMLIFHLLSQSLFAYCEHKRLERQKLQCSYTKKVGLVISAFQEDPWYLRQCLVSAIESRYPQVLLKIVMVVDGNTKEDLYMMEMFKEVFTREEVGTYIWEGNYHALETGGGGGDAGQGDHLKGSYDHTVIDHGKQRVEELVSTKRCVCIMQKWGGKREVMYTAFKALGDSVDYIQVCDSDTKLHRLATVELVKVLESSDQYGAVGGDVRILNHSESVISFMSSLRYWMAFNMERACQSYFNCVNCISGPLGLYRNDLLQNFLECWYHQTFFGIRCTFGDDRHLTNQILRMGYGTKYIFSSICYTETPAQLLRWLNQQTRWTKSYFREWLYNAKWWHKHHIWMTYESVVSGLFPFLVTVTVVKIFYTGGLWHILWVLLCIQLVGLIKGLYAAWLQRNPVMVFMSAYSLLYMASLLPTKYFAIFTINKTCWGTSGRRNRVGNYVALVPLSVWCTILCGGLVCATAEALTQDWETPEKHQERMYLMYGFVAYCLYWVCIITMYFLWVRRCCRKRYGKYYLSQAGETEMGNTQETWAGSLGDVEITRL